MMVSMLCGNPRRLCRSDCCFWRPTMFFPRDVVVSTPRNPPPQAEAERLLLLAALRDPRNQRMVLLSESCAPLYPPQVSSLLGWQGKLPQGLLTSVCSRGLLCSTRHMSVSSWHGYLLQWPFAARPCCQRIARAICCKRSGWRTCNLNTQFLKVV